MKTQTCFPRASLVLVLVFLISGMVGWSPGAFQSAQTSIFEIALPEINLAATAQSTLNIPSANLNQIEVHLLNPQADKIDYGQITARVNGEAAAGIFQTGPTPRGKIVRFDLSLLPGFALVPGRNTVEVTALSRSGQTYYASFVLSTTSNQLKQFNYQTTMATNTTGKTAPAVALLEPEGEIVLPAGRREVPVLIAGVATAASAIKEVIVQGKPVMLKGGAQAGIRKLGLPNEDKRVAFELLATIAAGTTRVPIEVTDTDGNRTQLQIPVRTGEAAPPQNFHGRKYALLVGVSKFAKPSEWMQNLRFADKDATALYEFLQTSGGGKFEQPNMLLLTNEQAKLADFRKALTEFVAKPGPEDLLIVFLATHGGPDPAAPQNRYFVLHDTEVDKLARTGLPMPDLQNFLQQNVKAKRMLLLVDTCESAGLLDQQITTRGRANNLTNLYLEKFLYREEGRAVITAADVNEGSLEAAKWGGGHGVFTHYLLEGLRGRADADTDRLVTVGELFRFVRQQVRVDTGFQQNPRLLIGTNENLKIAAVTR